MSDGLLSSADRQEALSRAYVEAVAAAAGYVTLQPSIDRDGVDLTISAGGAMRPALAIQLKATINLRVSDPGDFRFALKRRNYDLLRLPSQTPRLLVVLDMPRRESSWLSTSNASLILRRCAYWTSLEGAPETDNQEAITVRIPVSNRLDVASLRHLMERSRTGSIR